MWFDAQYALSCLDGAEQPRPKAAPPQEPETTSEPILAGIAGLAGGAAQISKTQPSVRQTEITFPYGESVGGRPLTCTGRVVSLDAWRSLTAWEKHGPNGWRWCGQSRAWTDPKD
jgi:hypothetical protein